MEDRNVYVLEAVKKVCGFPIFVIVRMLDPFAPVWVFLPQYGLIEIYHGQGAQQPGIFLFADFAHGHSGDIGGCSALQDVCPPDCSFKKKRSVLIRNVIEGIWRSNVWNHGYQMRRMLTGGPPLHPPKIGPSNHSDFAVGERLLGQPFNRVIAVFCLIDEWLPYTTRTKTAATILHRINVSATRVKARLQFSHFLFVRS